MKISFRKIAPILLLCGGLESFSNMAAAGEQKAEPKAAQPEITRAVVRANGELQAGFVEQELCRLTKKTEKDEKCPVGIVYEATGQMLSIGNKWISACVVDGASVKGNVPAQKDVSCLLRAPEVDLKNYPTAVLPPE